MTKYTYDELIEACAKRANEMYEEREAHLFKRMVETLESAQIVRCRDCKHAIDNGKEGNADYCGRPDGNGGYLLFGVEPDGFCAWGERRES